MTGNYVFADIILKNGCVYTADGQNTVHEAIGVAGDTILFVGSNEEAAGYANSKTRIINLAGKMVVPGLIDTHIHPPGLSLSELYEVQLFDEDSLAGYVKAVREFLQAHPDCKAIYGRGWSWGAFSGVEESKGPQKEYLDDISRDIPIILRARDGHSLWVNSKALELNGITAATVVSNGGVIEKDGNELWGTLKESAMFLIAQPEYTLEQYTTAMTAFQAKMHRLGITGILCIASRYSQSIFEAIQRMEQQGLLALHIRAAVAVRPEEELTWQFEEIGQLRQQFHSPLLQITTAKFFTDGVVEGATSFLLQPYAPGAGREAGYRGELLWENQALREAFAMANSAGLQIYVHSTGDASTQAVLDALEDIETIVPPGDYRNTITHLQLVDPADIPRFKQLGVIASVQPYWQFKGPNWWQNVDYRILGERAKTEYPLASFFNNDVVVTSSSDYPVTHIPNPILAMDIGVTRNMDNGVFYGVEDITDMDDERYLLNKEERATITQMLKSFTSNAAYSMFVDRFTGSLEPGKKADLAVLDTNLLTIDPIHIDKAKVVMTFFGGKLVYAVTE